MNCLNCLFLIFDFLKKKFLKVEVELIIPKKSKMKNIIRMNNMECVDMD